MEPLKNGSKVEVVVGVVAKIERRGRKPMDNAASKAPKCFISYYPDPLSELDGEAIQSHKEQRRVKTAVTRPWRRPWRSRSLNPREPQKVSNQRKTILKIFILI